MPDLTREEIQKGSIVTDAHFARARGDVQILDEEADNISEAEDDEKTGKAEAAEGEAEEGEEVPEETEEAEEDEEGKAEEEAEPAIAYGEISDEDLSVLPEATRDLARRALEGVREKDKAAFTEAVKKATDRYDPSIKFHEAFRDWEQPLLYLARDPHLQGAVAGLMANYFDNLKSGQTPEEAIKGMNGTIDPGRPDRQERGAGETPPKPFSGEIQIPEQDANALREMEKGMEEDVVKYFDTKTKAVSLGVGQAVANHVIAEVNKLLKTSLGPVLGKVSHLENLHVERSIQEQERELVREHGPVAKEFLKKDPKTNRNQIDEERVRADREDGERISIKTAFEKLAARKGYAGKSKRQKTEAFALRAREGKRASAGPGVGREPQEPSREELQSMSSADIAKLIKGRK